MKRCNSWSDKEDAELVRVLALKKYKAHEIAAMMFTKFKRKFTSNMIIGRTHRIKKQPQRDLQRLRRPVMSKSVKRKGKLERDARVTVIKAASTESVFGVIREMDEKLTACRESSKPSLEPLEKLSDPNIEAEELEFVEDSPMTAISDLKQAPHNCLLEDFTSDTCKYPLGGLYDRPPYIFCGDVTLGDTPFCSYHCTLCYTPRGLTRAKTRPVY